MAGRKIRTPGISYFGKKVETQEIRFDKNVFFEKQKSPVSNIVTTPATRPADGKQFSEVKGRRVVSLSDNSHIPVDTTTFFSAGILPMTPTAARIIQVPTAVDFISEALFENFSAFDFTIINKATSGGPDIGMNANTNVTFTGNPVIKANTSGTFRAVRLSSSTVDIYRL